MHLNKPKGASVFFAERKFGSNLIIATDAKFADPGMKCSDFV